MKTFTAHIRPDAPERPPILIKEAFVWGGFLFGPLWLLWHGAWIPAMLSVAALALALLAPPPLRPVLSFAILLLIGVLGADMLRGSLALRGYRLTHVVAGRSSDDAFLRLLELSPELGLW